MSGTLRAVLLVGGNEPQTPSQVSPLPRTFYLGWNGGGPRRANP